MNSVCKVEGCEKSGKLRLGMCQMHYRRFHLHGDVNQTNRRFNGDGKDYRIAQRADGSWDWEHIIIAENALGKPLPKGAQVHHVNFDRSDNANTNLVICPSVAYHKLLHVRTAALDEFGDANGRKCCRCHNYDMPSNMTELTDGRYYHNECNNAAMRDYHAKRREELR
jgi:HNH endonuclease